MAQLDMITKRLVSLLHEILTMGAIAALMFGIGVIVYLWFTDAELPWFFAGFVVIVAAGGIRQIWKILTEEWRQAQREIANAQEEPDAD